MRVFIVVTHLLGAGHLTRAAAIGRELAKAGHAVTLASGGCPTGLIDLSGLELVQLPPVRALVDDFVTLRDGAGSPVGPEYLGQRRARLIGAFEAARPDAVLTELYPFGRRALAREFDALLAEVASARPKPVLACSIRDILAPPGSPGKAAATHEIVRRRYDLVLVHGDPALVPLEASWPVDEALRRRLTYTGYIGPGDRDDAAPKRPVADGAVLVSGGSSAAALPLYRAAIEAARLQSGLRWRMLVGQGVAEPDFEALGRGLPGNAELARARLDFRALLSKAPIFVGQAGYNTVMDIVATQARAVLVPFEAGRETEQRMRADALAARGLATVLPERDLSGRSLLEAVQDALRRPFARFPRVRLDGAEQTVRLLERSLATRPGNLRAGAAP